MSEPTYNSGPSEQYGAPAYTQQPYSSAQQYPSAPQYPAAPAPGQYGGPPPSNAGWAVATIIFFWPLAFSAFNHLHSVFPKWSMGDYQGAQYASERVKSLGKIALGVGVGLIVLSVIMWFIMFAAFAAAVDDASTSTTYPW